MVAARALARCDTDEGLSVTRVVAVVRRAVSTEANSAAASSSACHHVWEPVEPTEEELFGPDGDSAEMNEDEVENGSAEAADGAATAA